MSGQGWGQGYITELEYTSNFYRELSPYHLQFAALSVQMAAPDASLGFNYLELGCGNGVTVNVLAANHPESQFWGLDFNPAHVVNAQAQAKLAGVDNVHFFDWSFEETLAQDLPLMDYIVLHGIYSWVNAENRRHICAIIKKLLRPGGLVYVSYNSLPGWSQGAPMRRLMLEFAAREGGSSTEKLQSIKQMLPTLAALPLQYAQVNPQSKSVQDAIATQDSHYVIHEYMNDSWDLFYVTDVAVDMHNIKMGYVGSAKLTENVLQACVVQDVAQFIEAQSDPVMRELVLDFATNKRFRRDIYIRGTRKLTKFEYEQQVLDTQLCLTRLRSKCDLHVSLPVGAVDLPADLYEPIFDALHKAPQTIRYLAQLAKLSPVAIMRVVSILIGLGYVCPSVVRVDPVVIARARKFNQTILNQTVRGKYQNTLIAPTLRSAMQLEEFDQYFVKAYMDKAADKVEYVWNIMRSLQRSFVENGAPLRDEAKSLALLRERAIDFEKVLLPLCKMWGIL